MLAHFDKVHELIRLALSLIMLSVLIGGKATAASPCTLVKSDPDAWTRAQVNIFVIAARAAYENDNALPAYYTVLDRIAGSIRKCRLSQDEAFMSHYRAFVEYIEAASLDRSPNHRLGFLVADEQYFQETREYVKIPAFLLDQQFLRSVSAFETVGRANSYLRQFNLSRGPSEQLIFFSYSSQHLGTPDNTHSYRRLLIIVPGNVEKGLPDKWVQFGVTDPGARMRIRNVSVVSAIPRADGTSNIYFKDYYRTFARDGWISVDGRWELGEGTANCVQCHKSGFLPIFPAPGSVSPEEQSALIAVNDRFLIYGSPRFGKYLDETKFGPGIGSAPLSSRIQRFGDRFAGSPMSRSMTCSGCHQHERLGDLNWPMNRVIIKSFVDGGQMPLGHALKISERKELYAKLIQEYFATDADNPGVLKTWLLGPAR